LFELSLFGRDRYFRGRGKGRYFRDLIEKQKKKVTFGKPLLSEGLLLSEFYGTSIKKTLKNDRKGYCLLLTSPALLYKSSKDVLSNLYYGQRRTFGVTIGVEFFKTPGCLVSCVATLPHCIVPDERTKSVA